MNLAIYFNENKINKIKFKNKLNYFSETKIKIYKKPQDISFSTEGLQRNDKTYNVNQIT